MVISSSKDSNIFKWKFRANYSEVNRKGNPEIELPISARVQRYRLF